MSIRALMKKSENTKFIALTLNNEVVGYRACVYFPERDSMEYYDFSIDSIKVESYKKFIRAHTASMERLPLARITFPNGEVKLCTQIEVDKKLLIKEFTSPAQVKKCLRYVIRVLQERDILTKAMKNSSKEVSGNV